MQKYKGYVIKPDTYGFEFYHEDYDGAPDSGDKRCGHSVTIGGAMALIDEQVAEAEEEEATAAHFQMLADYDRQDLDAFERLYAEREAEGEIDD